MPSFAGPILIAGHSQAKYFHQYLSATNIDVLSFSGFRISQMFEKIEPNISAYPVIVLHVGANDLSRGSSIDTMLRDFQDLTKRIWNSKPTAHIAFSGVLRRGRNQFPGAILTESFLLD